MRTSFPMVLFALILGGCGHAFLPTPTKKKVAPADAIGTWQYTADHDKTTIPIKLRGDGTFHQVVKLAGSSDPLEQDGSWRLEGAHIHLEKVLTHEGFSEQVEWVAETASWYFVESGGKPPLVIFGGTHSDPDSWQEFKKVR